MKRTNNPPMLFSNKLETLIYLREKLTASHILDLYYFSVREYKKNREWIFENISTRFNGEIIIRSSASIEDQDVTNAGHFFSGQHIASRDKDSVFDNIEKVISSYQREGLPDSEFIFVQKQLADVILSGVALSYEPKYGKRYFMINFDDSGSTDSVTSGKCGHHMYIARDFTYKTDKIEALLCKALLEIERCCNNDCLDVEFAITKEKEIYIFQVRPLKSRISVFSADETFEIKNKCKAEYSMRKPLLSDMAFWNPSEIIGDAPHPLDYSLYDCLITEKAWNQGIAQIGYFQTDKRLMVKIGNKPYIDLETAFLALTPSYIDGKLRRRIVEYYCQKLLENKSAHDKIEFEIAFTCFDFCTERKISMLHDAGFGNDEIETLSAALFQTTKSIVERYSMLLKADLKKLKFLESQLELCGKQEKRNSVESEAASVAYLLPLIRDYGGIPFARQARCAFIAHAIALSLLETGQISEKQLEGLMHSVHTVTQELKADIARYKKDLLTEDEMIRKYGHLRANTYNIASPTYKEIGLYKICDMDICAGLEADDEPVPISQTVLFPETRTDLLSFIKSAISQREYFKFVYTKALSYVLDVISGLSQRLGFSPEEISFLPIEAIMDAPSIPDARERFAEMIGANKTQFVARSHMILPTVISESDDFDVIRINEGIPNFITRKVAVGEICILDYLTSPETDISGKIVVLVNADPGFDWIFAKGSMEGLVTQYGGMASHMAIRCMEFEVPAAIGCGELIYDYVVRSKRIKLDCLEKKVVKV